MNKEWLNMKNKEFCEMKYLHPVQITHKKVGQNIIRQFNGINYLGQNKQVLGFHNLSLH